MDIQSVDYSTKIPNNVNLAEDRQVLRALEQRFEVKSFELTTDNGR